MFFSVSGGFFCMYDKLGGLCPGEWLKKWTKDGAYKFPDYDGFQVSTEKLPINGTELLLPGTLVDRFGRPSGKFLAPVYTAVSQRALLPWTLNPPLRSKVKFGQPRLTSDPALSTLHPKSLPLCPPLQEK
jgi:hypothetical protein